MNTRARRFWLALCCLVCLAPTPGDLGGCGQEPRLLGARRFFEEKREVDCSACSTCGIVNRTCSSVCTDPVTAAFPEGCFPLVHDGEVCLRALSYSTCEEYAGYLDDRAPRIPSECDFCPRRSDAGPDLE
jgi:hypothetical protein